MNKLFITDTEHILLSSKTIKELEDRRVNIVIIPTKDNDYTLKNNIINFITSFNMIYDIIIKESVYRNNAKEFDKLKNSLSNVKDYLK